MIRKIIGIEEDVLTLWLLGIWSCVEEGSLWGHFSLFVWPWWGQCLSH